MSRRCSWPRVVAGHAEDLVVAALLVVHPEHADGARTGSGSRGTSAPGRRTSASSGSPSSPRRVLDEAVVGRVLRGGEQRPVQPDPPALWSTSYLFRPPLGISMVTSKSTVVAPAVGRGDACTSRPVGRPARPTSSVEDRVRTSRPVDPSCCRRSGGCGRAPRGTAPVTSRSPGRDVLVAGAGRLDRHARRPLAAPGSPATPAPAPVADAAPVPALAARWPRPRRCHRRRGRRCARPAGARPWPGRFHRRR